MTDLLCFVNIKKDGSMCIFTCLEDLLKVKLHLRRWSESSFSKLSYNQMVRSNMHVEESTTMEL